MVDPLDLLRYERLTSCDLILQMAEVPERWMGDTVYIAERAVSLSDPDVRFLVDHIAELERALANAHRYLEVCREAIGAREGELLLDAIRRRLHESS